MMTCTSLRSGMASSGVLRNAQKPPAMPKMVMIKIRKVLRELFSMTDSRKGCRVGVPGCRGVGDSPMIASLRRGKLKNLHQKTHCVLINVEFPEMSNQTHGFLSSFVACFHCVGVSAYRGVGAVHRHPVSSAHHDFSAP